MAATNIVFDVGNVLVDWSPHHLFRKIFPDDAAIDAFLAEVDFHVWNREQDRGRSFDEGGEWLAERFPHHREAIVSYGPRFQEAISGPIQGTVDILTELRDAGAPLYAITNFNQHAFRDTQKRFPFLTWFRDVVVSGEERMLKPDPDIYHVLLRRNGLAPETCVFIDDSAANVAAAAALGMRAVRFTSPEALRREIGAFAGAAA
jgi:2-haloacid dehalogenase